MRKRVLRVNDLIKLVHDFAPPALAYEWDNSGFLVGDAGQEVKRVLLCLDITDRSVDYAVVNKVDLIISHHPLIFRPIKRITNPLYLKLIKHDIAVISAHTNLDITRGGVNHRLAELFELSDPEILSNSTGADFYQISVLVPDTELEKIKAAVFSAGAGRIGNYSECSSEFSVQGQFKPLPGSSPFLGKQNVLEQTTETKLEIYADGIHLNRIIKAMRSSHPYENPVYAVKELKQSSPNYGLGLIGSLKIPVTLQEMAQRVKRVLKAPDIKLWLAKSKAESKISRIAVCGGSGGSLISSASNRAELFIAGEFGYHNMLDSPIPLIEAGHFHTEFPVLKVLEDLLAPLELDVSIFPFEQHETTSSMIYL